MRTLLIVMCLVGALAARTQALPDSLVKKQTLHGVVKNEKNKPIPFASVSVEGDEKGVMADSIGVFRIDAKPNAVLIVTAANYESAIEMVNNREILTVVLSKSPDKDDTGAKDILQRTSINNAFQDYSKTEYGNVYRGSAIPVFHQNEETRGSRYLFKDWAKGTVINSKGELASDENTYFNYDKIFHYLLATRDKKAMIQADQDNIQSFTLQDGKNTYTFVKMPSINPKDFVVELVKSPKYSLYRNVKTHLEKANYQSEGLVESGKDYDEYVDDSKYFVLFADGKVKQVELKKKSIRDVFSADDKKVNAYLAQHKDDFLDEAFLSGLVNMLNQ